MTEQTEITEQTEFLKAQISWNQNSCFVYFVISVCSVFSLLLTLL